MELESKTLCDEMERWKGGEVALVKGFDMGRGYVVRSSRVAMCSW